MRFISTQVHGVIDYVVGVVLIAAPWILGFADGGMAQWVPVILGAATIIYSLLTDYELGLAHVIPMPVHLWLDGISGLFLAASPWLFGFADEVWMPHLIIGVLEILVALTTETHPSIRQTHITT